MSEFTRLLPKYLEEIESGDEFSETAQEKTKKVIAKKSDEKRFKTKGKQKERKTSQKRIHKIHGIGKGLSYKHGLLDNMRANNMFAKKEVKQELEDLEVIPRPLMLGIEIPQKINLDEEDNDFKLRELLTLREEKGEQVSECLSLIRRYAARRNIKLNAA